MTYVEQAIREAVEKGEYPLAELGVTRHPVKLVSFIVTDGWKVEVMAKRIADDRICEFWVHGTQITSDPLFWQALGKARGWGKMTIPVPDEMGQGTAFHTEEKWIFEAHAFFNFILTGGDTEEFWADLLKGV